MVANGFAKCKKNLWEAMLCLFRGTIYRDEYTSGTIRTGYRRDLGSPRLSGDSGPMKIIRTSLDKEVGKIAKTYPKGSPERDMLEWAARSLSSQTQAAAVASGKDVLELERLYALVDSRQL